MLSLTCKTAVKAVLYLASIQATNRKAGIREIAGFTNGNEHTVGKALQALVREGVINSHKGPSGGFYITKEQLRKPVISIVDAIDGRQVFRECGLGLSKCSATHPCPIHDEYKISRDHLERLFTRKRIADLCEPVAKGSAYLLG